MSYFNSIFEFLNKNKSKYKLDKLDDLQDKYDKLKEDNVDLVYVNNNLRIIIYNLSKDLCAVEDKYKKLLNSSL